MTGMLSLEEARARLLDVAAPLDAETIPLAEALGRTLAAPVAAERAQPPVAMSAMDGYAVRSADVAAPGAHLRLIGEAPAGAAFDGVVGAGEAVRIFTGGPVPAGADRVVIQENVQRDGEAVFVETPQTGNTNIRAAGVDFAAGETLLQAGEALTPLKYALAAAANAETLSVVRRPKVLIFSSGDEIVEPGAPLTDVSIINSAAYGVEGLMSDWGAAPQRAGVLPDDLSPCIEMLKTTGLDNSDLVISIGGASVGDRDVLKPAFRDLGADIIFEKVAVRPGKPVWFAKLPGGGLVLGLPGNPASAFACAHLFARPLIAALMGRDGAAETVLRPARLAAALKANGPREAYLRGRAELREGGVLTVAPDARHDSSLLTPFAVANVLIRRPGGAAAADIGDEVDVLLIGKL